MPCNVMSCNAMSCHVMYLYTVHIYIISIIKCMYRNYLFSWIRLPPMTQVGLPQLLEPWAASVATPLGLRGLFRGMHPEARCHLYLCNLGATHNANGNHVEISMYNICIYTIYITYVYIYIIDTFTNSDSVSRREV